MAASGFLSSIPKKLLILAAFALLVFSFLGNALLSPICQGKCEDLPDCNGFCQRSGFQGGICYPPLYQYCCCRK
ncbi:hypothetical protein FH972_014877 [Carpinus fangiana]|uniref:Knottin scorpion toxin-like domain-containing protein n=1 Tax=Carpinus fangiana TaxID=176857 RepID=A0A5N6RB19_9ROSI|nr:hypothetical protein FH972_014877 [Carpinus fangiana]